MNRVFLLSPANCGGKRAGLLLRDGAEFEMAHRLSSGLGVPLGEVFAFLSGLYFRGKLTYARAFASPPNGTPGIHVITPNRGLIEADRSITLRELRSFARVAISVEDHRYRRPFRRDARQLAGSLTDGCEVVLLGSIATTKYVKILAECFGSRLRIPAEFIGRGDMSRGGLMLRCVRERRELEYIPISCGIGIHK